MTHDLPPEDRPPNPGLVPTDDEQGAFEDAGPISPENPVAVGGAFLSFLFDPGGPNKEHLELVVTPESLPSWGDFTETADLLQNCGMSTRATPAQTDERVVYVKYITDHDGQTYQVQGDDVVIMARAVATLVYRPELGGWRIHGVGEYLLPEQVPH